MLTLQDTPVHLIFMSDGIHLSNFAGNKKECPVYMTMSNISSKIRHMPSMHTVVMVTLLLIPFKNRNVPQKQLDEQRKTNRDVLNEVLRWVLQPLTFEQNPNAESGYYNVLCAEGNFRGCKPVLAAWLADSPEYSDLHHYKRHVCFWCECPKNEVGDYVLPDKQHPWWNHNLYRTLSDANTKETNAELSSRYVDRGLCVLHQIPCIVSELPKPNLLDTMQNGMLDQLQKWIFHFMKTHEQLDKYNAIWLSVPAYHILKQKNMSYEEVSQWNGRRWRKWAGTCLEL